MPYFSLTKIVIGPITLQVWGIFVALGALIAYLFLLRQSKKKGIGVNIIHGLFVWVFLGGAVGSILLGQGGLASIGGIFGALLAGFLYFKFTKKFHLFLPIADIIALIIPISFAVGRIGCALINDHQGAETSLPWGIIWPDGAVRHPVAEYLIIANLLIFLILKYLKPKFKKPGQLFISFLFIYFFSRFFLDFTRSTGTLLSDPHYFGLSTSQWLSLLMIFATLIVGRKIFKKVEPNKKFIKTYYD